MTTITVDHELNKVLIQLPDCFTVQEFIQAVCDTGFSYDYGQSLLITALDTGSVLSMAPGEYMKIINEGEQP